MLIYTDCIACFVKGALDAARLVAPDDDSLHRKVVNRVCELMPGMPIDFCPPMIAERVHAIIREETGCDDPYEEMKRLNVSRAEPIARDLEEWVDEQPDPLEAAVRVAIAGNIIDLGACPDFDLEAEILRLATSFTEKEGMEKLEEALRNADEVLYLGDNTAEALFDKILIKRLLPRKVYFVTRACPIINDIGEKEARDLGLDEVATVLSSGSPIPGIDLERATPQFLQLFNEAPVVISKGQGNFESLSDTEREVFFLFKVKCDLVARHSGRASGSSVIHVGGEANKETDDTARVAAIE